jgi:hypothetical protein
MKKNQLRKLIRVEITKLNESFQGELEIIASESDTLDTFKQKAKEYGYGDVPDDELEIIWDNIDKIPERPVLDLGPIRSNESVNEEFPFGYGDKASINYLPQSFKALKTIKYKDKIIDSGYWTKGLNNEYTNKNTGKTEDFTVEDFQFFEKHIPSDLWITKDPGDYRMMNETKMKKSYLKDIIREAYLELKEEDDEGIEDDIDVDEDEFDEEPPVDQDKESKTQEEAPKKRIDFEGKELEMLVDVNRNPTKKGLKIQFLSDEELSKEERAKLVTALQTYLDEGLAKFVKGVRLNIDSDPDVPNKTKTVGFTIKIGDLFGLISKVFANRGDDEETGDEVEAEETEETEELQEIRNFIRGFVKQK